MSNTVLVRSKLTAKEWQRIAVLSAQLNIPRSELSAIAMRGLLDKDLRDALLKGAKP